MPQTVAAGTNPFDHPDAQRRFRSFEVATEPEKAIRGATWEVSQKTGNSRAFRRRKEARDLDGVFSEHPYVRRFDAIAHCDSARVGTIRNSAKSAWHYAPAVRRRGAVYAQNERPRFQFAFHPARRCGQPNNILSDIVDSAQCNLIAQPLALISRHFSRDYA